MKSITKQEETYEEMLKKEQEILEKKIQTEIKFAYENAALDNKFAALQALKRKKTYEKQLQDIDKALQQFEYVKAMLANSPTGTNTITDKKKFQHKFDRTKPITGDWTKDQAEFDDEITEAELIAELEELEREQQIDNNKTWQQPLKQN